MADFFASGGRLLDATEKLSGRGHSLQTIDDGAPDPEEMARFVEAIADPERPVGAEAFAAMQLRGLSPRLTFARITKVVAGLLIVTALTLAWHFTPTR